ncbi:MAG: hypothetical protein C4519_27645 [Desulfobacteraceae bacterium]|nr:MAG: hypothetical protein C4519_27645 [Desulfobacteraceae bacterium]
MKMKRIGLVVVIGLCLSMMSIFPAMAAKKVTVVSGVSEESAMAVGNYQEVYDGIKAEMSPKGITPEFLFVELEKSTDEAARQARGKEAADKIRQARPDLVITVNDNATKHIGSHISDIPVVFTFVWGTPESVGLPKPNITGVLRRSYAVDIFKMAKQLSGVNTVALLSKNNLSMAGIKKMFEVKGDVMEKASGVKYMDMFLCDTFDQWSQQVLNFKYDVIYLADTSRLIKADKELSREETVRWTVENAKVPVIAGSDIDVKSGALFAIVSSSKEWGRQAAAMGVKILGGTPVGQVPIEQMQKGSLIVNVKTAKQMNVNIPYEILSSAEKIFE